VVEIPSVPGTADQPMIPARYLPFSGYPVTVSVVIAQVNRFMAPDPSAGPAWVAGVTSYQVSLNDVAVYSPSDPFSTVQDALAHAAHAIQVLVAHPCRLYDPTDWLGRLVYYLGVPSTIQALNPLRGEVLVVADDGLTLPSVRPLDGDTPPTRLWVDLLTDHIWWYRTSSDPGDPPLEGP
jgi:hypothetical protein